MNERLRSLFQQSLGNSGSGTTRAAHNRTGKSTLFIAAERLLDRTLRLAKAESTDAKIDREALEAACMALSLPFTVANPSAQSSMGLMSITERCGQAAELLVGMVNADVPEVLIDRATNILAACPQKSTKLAEARVLSDAINIEDFGIAGLCRAAAMLVRRGGELTQLADALEKREQYGYWEARLKDGFHFDSTKTLARERLIVAREAIDQLRLELKEDR